MSLPTSTHPVYLQSLIFSFEINDSLDLIASISCKIQWSTKVNKNHIKFSDITMNNWFLLRLCLKYFFSLKNFTQINKIFSFFFFFYHIKNWFNKLNKFQLHRVHRWQSLMNSKMLIIGIQILFSCVLIIPSSFMNFDLFLLIS